LDKKYKRGIRFKVTLIIFVSAFFVIAIGIGLSYYLSYNLLQDTVREDHFKDAQLLAGSVKGAIGDTLEDLHSYVLRLLWVSAAEEVNSGYEKMDPASIPGYFGEMDKKWAGASSDDPFVKAYLGSRISISMQDVVRLRRNISEFFITDKFGGLVAASNKTSDFYQADEDWWQAAFNGGKGKDYIGDIEFDSSTGTLGIPFAIPIRNKTGDLIGICKAVVDASSFFSALNDFSVGKTGHVVLVNSNGDIIFHKGIKPLSVKFAKDKDFHKLIDGKIKWGIIKDPHIHQGNIFFIFAPVKHPLLLEKGIFWYIFVDQDAKEVFAPLSQLILGLSILFPLLIVIIVPVGFILSGILVKPIRQLGLATREIRDGNWDYPIQVKTGDEIEQFADTFKEMILNLKKKQEELLRAKKELEDLSSDLDNKVKLRTKELTDLQNATLNILEDLTEANKKLEDAVKIKSAFTSTVSHELRTPLTAIKESIAIVLDGVAGQTTAQQMEFLSMAKNNVDRLARLINDILDFQKLESGKMDFRIEENNINSTIEEVSKSMLPLADKKNLEFILKLDVNMPQVKFDKDKILQVLTNLINNAIKFTEKGSITISSEQGSNIVKVSVQDTGPGIKEENIPKLFQQFEQLEKGGDRKTGGTGLGLAISKEIIEAHKGKLWVESEFGKGTNFIFILPIRERRA